MPIPTNESVGNSTDNGGQLKAPSISLPKGGGAIRGIGEKFAANPVTGTGSMTVPIATSPGRSGFGPQLSLSYDSGSGNGPFGFGWSLSLPAITRKTDKGLPKYFDGGGNQRDGDVFILSGAEDLVPVLTRATSGQWELRDATSPDGNYSIRRYRPRIEGLFARIERWTDVSNRATRGEIHWRSLSKDNILTLYGKDDNARVRDPQNSLHVFSWLICETRDDKGNAILYEYKPEDGNKVDLTFARERNRGARDDSRRSSGRYIKRIYYGNRLPLLDTAGHRPSFLSADQIDGADWMFEVLFDYGEGHYEEPTDAVPADEHTIIQARRSPAAPGEWPVRQDAFSSYRAGFELRTQRLCRRVLMFHHFPVELQAADYLVRSTDFTYVENDVASFLTEVTQSGYVQESSPANPPDSYLKKSLPPVEFEYSKAVIGNQLQDVDPQSVANLPYGVDGAAYQWVDLDGEGLPGVLTEQGGAWFYTRNESACDRETEAQGTAARFAAVEQLSRIPGGELLARGGWQFLDLAGDGQVDLATFAQPTPGFFERTDEQDWKSLRTFRALPNLAWNDPNLKFIDLTGDGHADIMITDEDAICWYASLAEDGFGEMTRVTVPTDEERGPRVVFADGTQTISLADLSGDGLTDIVRIRNGEICYWPNLGYGRFGRKVTMDDAPWFEAPDQFDARRVRLADIDGSGTTDIIYLGRNQTRFWFNECGNAWGSANELTVFPSVDNAAAVTVVDLLGTGTACLVWSSPLPMAQARPMKYLNLMADGKPHLLVCTRNNLGAETRVRYAPSTFFYLRDKYDGKPWITRLPFPVHVVESVETYDYVSRSRFVERFSYHHGYFDGEEREFRGFGMVEHRDTADFALLSESSAFPSADNIDAASHVPPVLTRTWFHTGAYIHREHISNYFAGLLDQNDYGEYYRPSTADDATANAWLLPDTVLPDGLSADEEREACRALKGSMLRQEVYAEDDSPKAPHPYIVTEQNFTIRRLQPRGLNQHDVFFTHPREAISFHYERNPTDPRISHALTLEVDEFGNPLRSVAIGYPRAEVPERKPQQNETHITFTLNRFANQPDETDWYRIGLPVESRTFEVVKPPAAATLLSWQSIHGLITALVPLDQFEPAAADTLAYEQWNWRKDWQPDLEPGGLIAGAAVNTKLRLIEHVRSAYRSDLLTDLLPLGEIQSLALPGESYKLAFTAALLNSVFKRPLDTVRPPRAPAPEDLLPLPQAILGSSASDGGGYVLSQSLKTAGIFPNTDPDDRWWMPSGRVFFSPGAADSAAQEVTFGRAHFFLPHRMRDPFGSVTVVTYDSDDAVPARNHNLLLVQTMDALGNSITVRTEDDDNNIEIRNSYHVLQPFWVTDPNRNRVRVSFDALGMVVGTAVMGEGKGDDLDNFVSNLTRAQIDDLRDAADPRANGELRLGNATTRIVYDVHRFYESRRAHLDDPAQWQPAFAAAIVRETHARDLPPGANSKVQVSFSYSDGFGREIQKKIQAEPGEVEVEDAAGNKSTIDTTPQLRWVGNGWTIYNNKGKPIRKYESFFSTHHQFQFGKKVGVSPTVFYDPVERVVVTLHADKRYEKVVFDPWQQTSYDANDTVTQVNGTADPLLDPDVKGFFERLPDADYRPTWYEQRIALPVTDPQRIAAQKAAVQRQTPTIAYVDALGRAFLTIARNRFQRGGAIIEEQYATRAVLDIEGNQRAVIDAKDRVVMKYDYDMLSNRIHQASMEAGERWMLNDVSGKPIRGWDSRKFMRRLTYDQLRRPTELFVVENGAERLAEKTVYGESQGTAGNLRTRVYQVFDGAGRVTNAPYDFKGNLLQSTRGLLPDYRQAVNWVLNPTLNAGTYTSSMKYDALNRPTQVTTPDGSVYRPTFNEANLLNTVDVNLRGAAATQFVTNIDYNARGQRSLIHYGNGAETTYLYDEETFRLTRLRTTRPTTVNVLASQLFVNTAVVQDLRYVYDPVGNIMRMEDAALKRTFMGAGNVNPECAYTYDAIYRLIEANGREHIGQSVLDFNPPGGNRRDFNFVGLQPTTNDPEAVRRYTESYEYDEVGNFNVMRHTAPAVGMNAGNWTRAYIYEEDSLVESTATQSNRLTRTVVGNGVNFPETYTYRDAQNNDVHGCMAAINTMPMTWDFKDQLHIVDLANGGKAYYVYDSGGQRVCKVIERANGSVQTERRYLGGFEDYREYNAATGDVELVRETLHVMDDQQRIVMVETRVDTPITEQLIRYQFSNHLGSAALELDGAGAVISYEEYYPYGTSSYQAVRNQTETARRYRYTGKERDEETGLYYHEARYYMAWAARWISSDPIGVNGGMNSYAYVHGRPVITKDPSGKADAPIVNEAGVTIKVLEILTKNNWAFDLEVRFDVNVGGQIIGGRMDIVAHPPGIPKALHLFELKFENPALKGSASKPTPNQDVYNRTLEKGEEPIVPKDTRSNTSLEAGEPAKGKYDLVHKDNIDVVNQIAKSYTPEETKPAQRPNLRRGGVSLGPVPAIEPASTQPAEVIEPTVKPVESPSPKAEAIGGSESGSASIDAAFGMAGLGLTALSLFQTDKAFDAAYKRAEAQNSVEPLQDEAYRQTLAWGYGIELSVIASPFGGFFGSLAAGWIGSKMGNQVADAEIARKERAKTDPDFKRKLDTWNTLTDPTIIW